MVCLSLLAVSLLAQPARVPINWDLPSEALLDATVDQLVVQTDRFFHDGYYENAIRCMFAAAVLDPTFETAYEDAAYLVWSLGDVAGADEILAWGIAANPRSADLYGEMGMHCYRTARYAQAIDYLKHSVELQPSVRLQLAIGHCLRKLGKLNEALAAYKKAVEIDPEDPAARFNVELLSRELSAERGP